MTLRRKNPGGPPPKSHQQTLDRIEFLAEQSMKTSREIMDLVSRIREETEDNSVGDVRPTP